MSFVSKAEPYKIKCISCGDEMPDPDEKFCNGCVQTQTIKCSDCSTMPETVRCKACNCSVGPCCSKKMIAVILETDGTVRPMTDTVCYYSGCMEGWVNKLDNLLLAPHQKIFVSLATVNLLKKRQEIDEKRKRK